MTTPTSNPVPSSAPQDLLFNTELFDQILNGTGTVTDRLGVVRQTVAAAMATLIAFNARGAWATATTYALKDVVTSGGIAYVCLVAHTSGTFATDLAAGKWGVHQGATREELADATSAVLGAALVGFLTADGLGRTVRDKLLELRTPADVTGGTNTAIGSDVLQALTTGSNNTALGTLLLSELTTADANVAIGRQVMENATSGNNNTAVGTTTMQGTVGGDNNVAVGLFALRELDSGYNNTALGTHAVQYLESGSHNTGVGFGAQMGRTGGDTNTAVGYRAMYSGGDAPVGTGSNNTALGGYALRDVTSGFGNVAAGLNAGQAVTSGAENVALGANALAAATAGSSHVAVGARALLALTSGLQQTAVGTDALAATTTGDANAALGYSALASNTTGANNTAVGHGAGLAVTGGSNNTIIGKGAAPALTTGYQNAVVGAAAAVGATSINNTALGYGATTATYNGCSVLGAGATVTGDSQVQLGASGTTTYAYGAIQNRSDKRDKLDIKPTVLGLDFINALEAVDYRHDYRDSYFDTVEEVVEVPESVAVDVDTGLLDGRGRRIVRTETVTRVRTETVTRRVPVPRDGSRAGKRRHHGLLAQQVRDAAARMGVEFGGFQDHSISGGEDVLSLGYTELIAPLIRAVQQLSARVTALEPAQG